MAEDRKSCIDEVIAAMGGRVGRDDINYNFEEINARAAGYEADGMDRMAALSKAAEEVVKEQAIRNAILKRNARNDAMKLNGLRQFVDAAPDQPELAIEARLTGVNTPLFDEKSRAGNLQSAAALAAGMQKNWRGMVENDLRRIEKKEPKYAGLTNLFFSRKIERDIFREKWELDSGESGSPGITKNEPARRIAEVLHKADKVRVDALNNEGAWISNYRGYLTRMFHDPDRIRRASNPFIPADPRTYIKAGFTEADRAFWVDDVIKYIDTKRTFGGQDPKEALATAFGGHVVGDHMRLEAEVGDEPLYPNLARKASAERQYHWKSADAWMDYNEKYGRFSVTDAWLYSLNMSARHVGLMKVFGSKPREGFEALLAYAKDKYAGKLQKEGLLSWDSALNNRFQVISGETDRPISGMWSKVINGWMSVKRMASLGSMPITMIADNVTVARELSRHNMNFIERWTGALGAYGRGSEGSAKREVIDLLHAGLRLDERSITARFDVMDAKAGTMAWLESQFFRLTGATWLTETKRASSEALMAYAYGKEYGKAFSDLHYMEQNLLRGFGIGDEEWALLNKVEWNTIEGDTYLTPDVAMRISDADMGDYLKKNMSSSQRAIFNLEGGGTDSAEHLAARGREELALKLWAYYAERGKMAVIETGAREKAILYQGTQSGSPLNNALRLFMQFKQFPTAMLTKVWGAEIYGGAKGFDRIAGAVEMMAASTLAGVLIVALGDLVKGQDPRTRWQNNPGASMSTAFLRGGAGSIYGDLLMGEWSRFGQSALDTIAGPTFGQINTISEIWADVARGKQDRSTAASLLKLARSNIPFLNIFYARAAVDYMFLYRLQEYMNPGYLKRMERNMKDKQGVEFLMKPSQVYR